MAVPLQIQMFDAFLGTQEGIHSVILPDIFSSGGSKNVYIDKFGRVRQIAGYTRQNPTPFGTDGGSSTCIVRGLIPFRLTTGGTVVRRLLCVFDDGDNEWEIRESTDNGITLSAVLYDAGAGSVGMTPDGAQFGNELFLTNGKVQPRVYDGASITATGLSQSPTITATEAAASGNLSGNYAYKLVSTIAGARQAGSAISTNVLLTSKQMTLGWTADANVSVDGYEIYRTTGTGTTFYYLASIDGRATVAYTDNFSDIAILENRVMEEHGDAPPIAYFCEPHKQRMWWLRTDAFPTRGYWSDPGAPESVYVQSFLDFSDSETVGDIITGGLGNYEGLFVVFTEKAIWTVSGTGGIIGDIVDWTKTRTNAQIGCVTHRAAARVPAGSKYSDQTGQLQTTSVSSIAYFTPLGDIRLFDGENDLIISHPVRDTVRGFNYSQRHKTHAVIDSENDQIVWFFASGNASEPNLAVSWNYRYGVWYRWETMPFGASVQLDTSSDAALLLVGESDITKGCLIYKFLDGATFDGSNIEAAWMTKTLYGVTEQGQPALSNRKRWRWADILFKVDQDVAITVEWLSGAAPDNAAGISSTVIMPGASFLVSADGSFFTTADGSQILLALASAQEKAILHSATGGDYLHDEGIRLRVSTNSSAGQWSLEAMQVAYQILPGLKRRDQ